MNIIVEKSSLEYFIISLKKKKKSANLLHYLLMI